MIIVCGAEEQRQLATASESILSSKQGVAEMGFEKTLGNKNVYEGTRLHKGIIHSIWNNRKDSCLVDQQLVAWQSAIREALEIEGPACDKDVDFIHLIRRIMLRATVEIFIGKAFLRHWTTYNFLNEFMDFQDTLEDVTAKAVVLPKWLALVAMLWPFQRRRNSLQLVIQERIKYILRNIPDSQQQDCINTDIGFWLQEVLSRNIPLADIAEFILGLLFASHKNPAIGAAQSYLFLREHASEEVLVRCRKEATELLSTTTPFSNYSRFTSSLPTLRRICLESLRLTAHSIGGIRVAQKDMTIFVKDMLYKIPKGASVGFAHITSSLDSSIWGKDALTFDSSLCRYPEEHYMDDYKFTTFSHGIHKCPGRSLAMIQLQVTIALLLIEYKVSLPECIPPLDFERATLAQRKTPVIVRMKRFVT